jgi:hypothetical protein
MSLALAAAAYDEDDDAADVAGLARGRSTPTPIAAEAEAEADDAQVGCDRGSLFTGFIFYAVCGPDAISKSQRSILLSSDDASGSRAEQRNQTSLQKSQERAYDSCRGTSAEQLKDLAEIAQRDEAAAAKDRDQVLFAYNAHLTSLRGRMMMELTFMDKVADKEPCIAKYNKMSAEAEDLEHMIMELTKGKRTTPEAVTLYLALKKPKPDRDSGGGSSSANFADESV